MPLTKIITLIQTINVSVARDTRITIKFVKKSVVMESVLLRNATTIIRMMVTGVHQPVEFNLILYAQRQDQAPQNANSNKTSSSNYNT